MLTRELLDNEVEAWNSFVKASPCGDLLQSYEWGEFKQRSGGWKPLRIGVFEDNKIIAAISILKRSIPHTGRSIFYAPRGPICDYSNTAALKELFDAVKDFAKKEKAILVKIDPAIKLDNHHAAKAIEEIGFIKLEDKNGFGGIQPKCVMQLDLNPSLDRLLLACKSKWRYNIRLAEKRGVTIKSECSKDDLKVFYDILKETAKRDKFLVRGFSYYEDMWDTLIVPGHAKLFLAEYEGEAIAGAISFVFGDKCWYTYGASSNRHRNVMPNHLMQWKMITWAKELGCKIYDFRGVSQNKDAQEDDNLQGLNRFKEGFGAEFVEYIGEYDLPYSKVWYWAWTKGKPIASSILKRLRRNSISANNYE